MSAFAASLLPEWQRLKLPEANAAIVIAVSGGADSTALFLAFQELLEREKLRLKLIVAHLDHGLRASSNRDARWVAQLAKRFHFDVALDRVNLKSQKNTAENLEQAARKARYQFLRS